MHDAESGVLIIDGDGGFSDESGQLLWDPGGYHEMCAAGNSHVVLSANSQLGLVDSLTGEQVAYSDSLRDCLDDTFGRYGWSEDGTVVALLP